MKAGWIVWGVMGDVNGVKRKEWDDERGAEGRACHGGRQGAGRE